MDARARFEPQPRARRVRSLINAVLFKAGWFVGVLGAAQGSSAPALAWAGLAIAAALGLAAHPARVGLMVASCTLIGLIADGSLVAFGAVSFPLDPPAVLGVPIWIGGIWLLFATTFDGCLSWLAQRPILAALLGAIGSPLSYRAAQALGALEVADAWPRLLMVSVVWGLLLPIQFAVVRRLVRSGPR
jgi:hypothetical protein